MAEQESGHSMRQVLQIVGGWTDGVDGDPGAGGPGSRSAGANHAVAHLGGNRADAGRVRPRGLARQGAPATGQGAPGARQDAHRRPGADARRRCAASSISRCRWATATSASCSRSGPASTDSRSATASFRTARTPSWSRVSQKPVRARAGRRRRTTRRRSPCSPRSALQGVRLAAPTLGETLRRHRARA